jgi:DNA-3-methyladenine glycosylase II
MPKTPRARRDPWSEAVAHIRTVDPEWSTIIDRIGPCVLRPRTDRFSLLVRAIVGQQISTKAAAAIDARLRVLGSDPHTPEALLALGEDGVRAAGTSGVKARYILNVAEAVQSGQVPLDKFGRMSDEAIVESLTTIKGVGVWTAQMFLIFVMNRPDVLPSGDLGVRVALRNRFGLEALPTPRECEALAAIWRPYRTVAMWYLWRSLDNQKRAVPPPSLQASQPK